MVAGLDSNETTSLSGMQGNSSILKKAADKTSLNSGRKPISFFKPVIQPKLSINQPNDVYEQEADAVADKIMSTRDVGSTRTNFFKSPVLSVHRKCEQCEEEEEQKMQRKEKNSEVAIADDGFENYINTPGNNGQPMPGEVRNFYEGRFGYDFSNVRIHSDQVAAKSAQSINALAYTSGNNIVFDRGQYSPDTDNGKRLLAHELTHVVQQQEGSNTHNRGVEVSSSGKRIARADTQAVAITNRVGVAAGTGLQFWPTTVTDTRVGPVSVQGGLLSGGANRLNVIIGENMTPRILARELLPLWITATPFTPPGAAAPLPLDIITEDELAQGLMVYNQYYVPFPAMTNWRSGFRLPLPVEIDAAGIATLHPLLIKQLATAFAPAWLPMLDGRAGGIVPAATLQADVTAFLAREPTALARGMHLSARALTNAVAELPFIRETFRQLGAGAFDVALAFMDAMVNNEISLLASQRDGALILTEIRNGLGAAPVAPTADQQSSLTRANLMLGLVAATVAVAPPTAITARPLKNVAIDLVKLQGSTHDPLTDITVANSVLAQCNVRLTPVITPPATLAETNTWLHGDTNLTAAPSCTSISTEERTLVQGATARFGLASRIKAFFLPSFTGFVGMAYSRPPFCATGGAALGRNMVVIPNVAGRGDLAHETVHILTNLEDHRPAPNLMSGDPLGVILTNTQRDRIYNGA